MSSRRVMITGAGIVCSIGTDFAEFTESLRVGRNAAGPIQSMDASEVAGALGCEALDFDPHQHFSARELQRMDRSSKMAVVAAREAMAMAGLSHGDVDADYTAVSLGSTLGGSVNYQKFYQSYRERGKGRKALLLDQQLYVPGNRIAHEFGFGGGGYVFSNACASSNSAMAYAHDLITIGDADVVITGGFDTMAKMTVAGFNIMRNVSPTACRPFDKNRDGLILGEGAGIIVLESEEHMLRRGGVPMAEFLGYGQSTDAKHMTAPDPTAKGPAAAVSNALKAAKVEPQQLDYINGHGTGTPHNDASEARAIHRVFGDYAHEVPVSSTKSMHGHCLGATGGIEAVTMLAAIRNGFVPGTPTFQTPDDPPLPGIRQESHERDVKITMSNNFGFGGSNSTVVFGRV
ncbi:beta-ketoacyl-[acyl-carrier-protein] synthase family protein [Fodinicurvata sp. EGI_FJ10296]|uniref:beta-ketoacyl-[acyl-carrier-protein] synthase family protein n=1 Tax=Fodinicurvata sp. EGI_FJ10296 TaxID=3231908 RepID=UPI00345406E2